VSMHKIILVVGFDVRENVTIYINCQLFVGVHMANYFYVNRIGDPHVSNYDYNFFKIDTYFKAWFT